MRSFNGGLAPMAFGDRWGFINTSGEMVLQPTYDNAEFFVDAGAQQLDLLAFLALIDT